MVKFVRGSFEEISNFFSPNSFDIVFSVYALQYCLNVESMRNTFRQVLETLIPEGDFVFSLDHPLRAIGKWDENEDIFILDNYFDRNRKEWDYVFPETGIVAKMEGSFMTLSDIINSIIDSGFTIKKILEPEPVEVDKNSQFGKRSRYGFNDKRDPYSFDHLSKIPGTLIIKAKK